MNATNALRDLVVSLSFDIDFQTHREPSTPISDRRTRALVARQRGVHSAFAGWPGQSATTASFLRQIGVAFDGRGVDLHDLAAEVVTEVKRIANPVIAARVADLMTVVWDGLGHRRRRPAVEQSP